jgi:hypothetical protein
LPAITLTDVAAAASVKLALGITRDTAAFDVNPPPVPVMVSGYVPPVTVAPAVKFRVVVPLALSAAGEKAAVTPAGRPVTANADVTPLCVAVTVTDAELLTGSVNELTLAVIASDGTETTNETVAVCLIDPLVPVMVKVWEPAAAVEAAVNLSTLTAVPLMLVGEKAAVTPLGRPAIVSATAELNPFCGVAKTFTDVELPAMTGNDVSDDASAKLGVAITSDSVTVCLRDPLVAVMVTVDELPTAVVAAVNLRALTPVPMIAAGVKVAVTPVGKPETANATVELNPFCGVTVRFTEPEAPGAKLSEVALADNPKFGAVTTTGTATVAVCPPPLPVTVRL